MLSAPSTAYSSISASSASSKSAFWSADDGVLELRDAGGADQRRGHAGVAEDPGDRELGQRLAPPLRDLVERAHAREVLGRDQLSGEVQPAAHARVLGHAVEILVREHALGQRREGDGADALAFQDAEELGLDPAVEHRVGRLMDEQRRPEVAQDLDRLLGAPRAVGGDPGVQGLALAHGAVQRAHRLLQRRLGVGPVRVEDVHVVQAHAAKALVQARQQVLARAPVPVGPGPHVVAGLGGDDELVTQVRGSPRRGCGRS